MGCLAGVIVRTFFACSIPRWRNPWWPLIVYYEVNEDTFSFLWVGGHFKLHSVCGIGGGPVGRPSACAVYVVVFWTVGGSMQ